MTRRVWGGHQSIEVGHGGAIDFRDRGRRGRYWDRAATGAVAAGPWRRSNSAWSINTSLTASRIPSSTGNVVQQYFRYFMARRRSPRYQRCSPKTPTVTARTMATVRLGPAGVHGRFNAAKTVSNDDS